MSEPLSFSFEFIPPATQEDVGRLMEAVEVIVPLRPSFISLSSPAQRVLPYRATDVLSQIHRAYDIPVVAHLTGIGKRRDDIRHAVEALVEAGATQVMVLRGDLPLDGVMPPGDFLHASDLVAFLREIKAPFRIGAACYPSIHPEAASAADDLQHLKQKVDAGVDFLVSQMFFDPESFITFTAAAWEAGIHTPIIPGIMPIVRAGQTQSFARKCGVAIPENIRAEFVLHDPAEDISAFGQEMAVVQCQALLRTGIRSFHFYTLNQASVALSICERLRGL
ncbi:MAG: 5,10-methylenetetrahydrofolate reductase [Candidatus Parcubacteria bacterium]|jgi:methylenetetrahydrofolate reductase (NADPH)